MVASNYVFGFGSLVHEAQLLRYLDKVEFGPEELFFCRLQGYRRCWNVAMDNRLTLPGYKYFVDGHTGQRPSVYVTFLNIRVCPDTSIAGVLFKVSSTQLEKLDKREQNYTRINIESSLQMDVPGKCWVYIGTPEAKQRFDEGFRTGAAVISQAYHDLVYEAYHSRGEAIAQDYLNSTDKLNIPVVNLKVVKT